MMPKISIGLIPDCPTHCADIEVVSHVPKIVMIEATIPISVTIVNTKARTTITIGAQRMLIKLSPSWSLLNIEPKISLALGIIPLTRMPTPVPTIIPMPSDDLIFAAVTESQRPNSTPPIKIPKSPISAPRNQTPTTTGPMIYPMEISIGESQIPIKEP